MKDNEIITSSSLHKEVNEERKREGKESIPAINNFGGTSTNNLARKDKSWSSVPDFFAKLAKGKGSRQESSENYMPEETKDTEALELIYNLVVDNVTYDREKASTVAAGYLPDIDETLETGKGICFDYAALISSMRNGIFLIPALFILSGARGLSGIQEAQPLAFALTFAAAIFFFVWYMKKLPREDREAL